MAYTNIELDPRLLEHVRSLHCNLVVLIKNIKSTYSQQ